MTEEFLWILVSGLLMSAVALIGGLAVVLPERLLRALVLPLVALAAGSLLGGAFFHMVPASIAEMGNRLSVYLYLVLGFLTFFCLEQFLHWHHCHKTTHDHRRPLGYLILLADGLHNFIGGLAVAGAFLINFRVGVTTWLVAVAHEVPQELGDFGALVHAGWKKKTALLYNFLSAITFLFGGLLAYWASSRIDVAFLLPFAAGNFIYIAAADLVPEINKQTDLKLSLLHFGAFVSGLGALLAVRLLLS